MLDEIEEGYLNDDSKRAIAENEARFRVANERIEGAAQRFGVEELTLPFICECGRPSCVTVIRATVSQYESVRGNPRYFMCARGHAITTDGIGRVVSEEVEFEIVEKLGVAADVADATDPR